MDVTHETVQTPTRRRAGWSTDNPLVRAIGRLRLPLGAKLIGGFTLIATLLAVAVVLGLLALGDSNSRGKKLLSLQKETAYEQLLLTDANHLAKLLGNRTSPSFKAFGLGSDSSSLPAARQAFLLLVDSNISSALTLFQADFSRPVGLEGGAASLRRSAPVLARIVQSTLNAFRSRLVQIELKDSQRRSLSVEDVTFTQSLMASLRGALNLAADKTSSRARELVAQNDRAFDHSRSLLIGVGAGSLGLALVLGLLLSWSVVAPLRRTEERLAEIGAGDFARRLEVANRDEIGTLARRVNRMSDELQRVYGELELASRHKSDFLATMSHELRTPLNAIIGFSEVLHEQMFGELNERQLAYVNDVLAAGRHLLELINDVLDLAKIEAGRMELTLSEVAIPELLQSAVSMHSERADRAGIALELATDPEEITITADERRVRQIVFNLLSNAVKFTPADGRVDVSASLDDGQVEIAVADTGRGIPADELEAIFEEFEQAEDGKQADEGTGLGLPLSRKLVELHGGRLWAESELGKGSTFRFTLPVHQESDA
jgi:signal transduction histidine kinase